MSGENEETDMAAAGASLEAALHYVLIGWSIQHPDALVNRRDDFIGVAVEAIGGAVASFFYDADADGDAAIVELGRKLPRMLADERAARAREGS